MKCVKLKNIADVISGGTAPKDNEFSSDGIPFIRVSNLDFLINGGNETSLPKVDEETAKKKKYKLITKGTIVFAKSGMSSMKNRVYELRHDAYIVNHLAGIMFRDTQLSPYMKYWLENFKPSRLIVDEAYPSIRLSDVKEISINLPPLQTQKKIVGVLDKAQELIALRKKQIELFDDLIQSIFYDMFGDPVTNPKGWEVKKLEELGEWKSGGTPARKVKEYYEGNIPWVSSGELNTLFINDSLEHITMDAVANSAAKIMPKGSIMLGMYDTAALKSSIATTEMTCNQAIAFSKLNDDKCNTLFVYYCIQIGKEHYRRMQRGVRQKNMNLSMIKGMELINPELKLQNQFAQKVQKIEQQKHLMQQSLTEMENNFNSLMQRAFKGKLFN